MPAWPPVPMPRCNMEKYVAEDWQLVDDDGLCYWRLKSDIAADVSGASAVGDEDLLFPPEMLTVASKSALQRKKKMLLAKKARYAAEIKQWEELLELAAQDFPAVPSSAVESRPQASATPLFPDLYQKLLNEVEKLEDCVKDGNNLILRLEAQINARAQTSFYSELQLTTPVLSARKIQKDLLKPSSGDG